jgi:hypothetical protein
MDKKQNQPEKKETGSGYQEKYTVPLEPPEEHVKRFSGAEYIVPLETAEKDLQQLGHPANLTTPLEPSPEQLKQFQKDQKE